MKKVISFNRPTEYKGRNGVYAAVAMSINNDFDVIGFTPRYKRGDKLKFASCFIQIPGENARDILDVIMDSVVKHQPTEFRYKFVVNKPKMFDFELKAVLKGAEFSKVKSHKGIVTYEKSVMFNQVNELTYRITNSVKQIAFTITTIYYPNGSN